MRYLVRLVLFAVLFAPSARVASGAGDVVVEFNRFIDGQQLTEALRSSGPEKRSVAA
jgi:hypothetical protein